MNTKLNANSIKSAIVSAIAVSMVTLPLLASAGGKDLTFLDVMDSPNSATDQEILYTKLKEISRDLCGSSDLRLAGSLERAEHNDECYEGTVAAAVARLYDAEITALHRQES